MSVMLDIVISMVIFSMLTITMINVNINLSDGNYKSFTDFKTQTELIQLGRILEFDLYKAGYTIPTVDSRTGEKIAIADTSSLKFYTNLFNGAGEKDSVEYDLGGSVGASTNPRDRLLVRYENLTKVYINYSVTRFKLTYYNTKDSLMATPVTGAFRDSIRSIRVLLTLESPEPFDTTRSGGNPYITTTYTKLIYPRNL